MSITQTTRSPHVKLRSVDFGAVQWTRGFWADRFAACRDVMVPAMGRLMIETERPRFLGNFEVAAGKIDGRHRGPKWDDGDFYKWLESAAAIYGVTRHAQIDETMDAIIALIGETQAPDGYIHTDVQIARRQGQDLPRFGNPMDFEMYNMGHLITAACVHHRATGKSNLLSIARKAADFLAETFANPTPEQARHGICPSHLMGLVELYRTTGEKKYLDLAITLLNMRDLVTRGDDDNQDRIPFRKQTTAHGHAVRATYLYAGAADIFIETGDATLLEPLRTIWRDLVTRKLYITGGCGALFDGASPDGAEEQLEITRVHQAFGRNYQLPHSTAHNETCAAIGNLMWNWRMLQITGESRFADVIEQTLYNSVLAAVSLDGTAFFYTNTLRNLDPMPVSLRWPRHRQPSLSCFCCPPNVVRTIAETSHYAYAQSDRGLYVILFGGSVLSTRLPDGTPITVVQETDYPWDGRVRLRIESGGGLFSLFMRIPGWAGGASIAVNGQDFQSVAPGAFHDIRRDWSAGDVVELELPMPARLIEANPYVEEALNQCAVLRGPLVYCLESIDLPAGVGVLDVLLPNDASFDSRPFDELLPGLIALHTQLLVRPRRQWNDRLYRERTSEPFEPISARLIPYFAWDNRGEGEMTVWIPVAH